MCAADRNHDGDKKSGRRHRARGCRPAPISPVRALLERDQHQPAIPQGRGDFAKNACKIVILIGALVHVPHDDFARIFSKIAAALRDGGLMLITLKEGADGADGAQGDNRAHGADGRIFYLHHDSDLRRTFAALGFDVLDFKQSGLKRVLFIAHRENILCRARESFAKVMRNPSFGSILGGGNGKVSEYAPDRKEAGRFSR